MQTVDGVANQNGMTSVTQVFLQIGDFAGVEPDALSFAFDVLKKDTLARNAELVIERLPILLYCNNCENEYVGEVDDLRCPVCEGESFELRQGREMILRTITGERGENGKEG